MKNFVFTVDDNIRFLSELAKGGYCSIFEHPYLALYKRFHERYGLNVQLNLFYECDGFSLSDMPEKYKSEFEAVSDWLKMSFHSRLENLHPYESSSYCEVLSDCNAVNREIVRFAGEDSLAKTTTIHYCRATNEGCLALRDAGVSGLLGLYGTVSEPRLSYAINESEGRVIRSGENLTVCGITHAAIDLIINTVARSDIADKLSPLLDRQTVKIMIHEQYFYPDYPRYQPDFEEKLNAAFYILTENGFKSAFFEKIIK